MAKRLTDAGLLILRVGLGAMMIWHGLPKLLGGPEKWESVGGAMRTFGIDFVPEAWGLAAALSESVGGLLLAIGLLTRGAASFLLVTMFVAAARNWTGKGFAAAAHPIEDGVAFLALIVAGAGAYSLDAALRGRLAGWRGDATSAIRAE